MVEKGDKDILRALELHQHSLACFRTDEDVFVLISFSDPKPEYYRKSPLTSHYVQQDGDLEFSKYNQGVHEASVSASGLWAKRAGQDDATATFSTPEKVEPNANIDDSEISFKYRFQNQSKTQTRYIIQIRRSTLRFVEHFQWDGLNAPRKSDSLSSGTSTSDGYCVQIN